MMIVLFAISNMLRGMDKWSPLGKFLCGVVPAWSLWQLGYDNPYQLCTVAALSTLGCLVGHGTFYRLNHQMPPARADNWPAILPRKLGLKRDTWLFNALALGITGMCWTGPVALFLALYGDFAGAGAVALAGMLKPLAYELGWRLNAKDGDPIAWCEMYNGLLFGASLLCAS